MKQALRLIVVSLIAAPAAYALPMEELLARRAAPRGNVAPKGCANFAGDWEGTCQVAGQSVQDTLRIQQSGCDSVTVNGDITVVKGLKSQNLTMPAGPDGAIAISVTQAAQWENNGAELASRYTGFLSLVDSGTQVPVEGSSRMKLDGEQLVHDAEVLGIQVSCLYDRK